jgi:hypothetical protein
MPTTITKYRVPRNSWKITGYVFISYLIELWLNGITTYPLPGHNVTICLNASAFIILSHIIRSRAAGIEQQERIVTNPALLRIMAPFWSTKQRIGLRALGLFLHKWRNRSIIINQKRLEDISYA